MTPEPSAPPDPSTPVPHAADPDARRRFGRYYTPRPLTRALFGLLDSALAGSGGAAAHALCDPCCGPGAFLSAPEALAFRARLGLDLDVPALEQARKDAPDATLITGDAYAGGLDALCAQVAGRGPLAVVGNPPYVANSELLKSGRYHEVRDRLLPFAREVAKGSSVRDDYVLFFGVADRLLEAAGGGAIAFVTSASFVDNFLYAPLRRWLLSRYRLHALVELGPEVFEGTRVATALSVWVREPQGQAGAPFQHARLEGPREARLEALEAGVPLAPAQPHGEKLLLNAPNALAARELTAMRAAGDPIGELFPLSFPGLKTRFEELLVDEDGGRLLARMRDFFEATDAAAFGARHGIPEKAMGKLEAAFAARSQTKLDRSAIRPFARFAGPKHRFRMPRSAMAWTYLDPVLIPRGDHRLHGPYDPHLGAPKLVFNAREIPLVAAVVEGPSCVHDWRHSRFAPLFAPARLVEQGAGTAKRGQLGPSVLNLTPRWAAAAQRFHDPSDLLFYVCAVVNSALVQERFAPAVGASEELPLPRPEGAALRLAQQLAQGARAAPSGSLLEPSLERFVRTLYGL